MKTRRIKKHSDGFTLIEILVVMSIIAILAAIILASIVNGRQKALDAKVTSERAEIQRSLDAYNAEYGGYPNDGNGSQDFYCIGGNCEFPGPFTDISTLFAMNGSHFALNTKATTTPNKNLAAVGSYTFSTLTDMPEFTVGNDIYRGFIYVDCASTDPVCLEGSGAGLITTTFYAGLNEYAVGTWLPTNCSDPNGGSSAAYYSCL